MFIDNQGIASSSFKAVSDAITESLKLFIWYRWLLPCALGWRQGLI